MPSSPSILDGVVAPTLTLEVDASRLRNFALDRTKLGGAQTLGFTPNWRPVSMLDVVSIAIRRGREREDQTVDAGELVIELDNDSGWYDPDNGQPGNPFADAGVSILRRGLRVRLTATYGSTSVPLFHGTLDDATATHDLEPLATWTCVDGLAFLNGVDLEGRLPLFVETTASRLHRVLDLAGWPSEDRMVLGAGDAVPQPLTADTTSIRADSTTYRADATQTGSATRLPYARALTAQTQEKTAAGVIQECANAEGGRFYVDAAGRVTLATRGYGLTRPQRFTLSDDGTGIDYDPATLRTSAGARTIVNSATVKPDGETDAGAFTVTDALSASYFGLSAQTVYAPLRDPEDIQDLAVYRATIRSAAATRVDGVAFDGIGIGSAWESVIATELGDGVRVVRQTAGPRLLDLALTVEGIAHTITPSSWTVEIATSPIDTAGLDFKLDGSLMSGSDVLTSASAA